MKRFVSIVAVSFIVASSSFAASIESGKALVEKNNCASCHGPDLKSPIAPNYPKIAGQHQDYLFYALKAYQVENNPQVGRGNAIMAGQAKQFNLAQLKDMAAYIATLPSDLVLKK
ncbi:cytochrome c [Polynucleobacter sp. SHI8]|jgi:cytochrome c553|uniref:c-type cytochrome n=1 Tax=unclassified Polynucleobacter TaxID=2640945 RepID=UPI0024928B35|nr:MULTISPECIES: cytochrome c [unclassified Polynucleobacter]BDW11064.1 cytochrome c [Polynucleobacter sp. SHI2]BDW13510.1 cytochrome c [Polynucleobacter sp. SHI8]